MITINTSLFNVDGNFILYNRDLVNQATGYKDIERRVSRTKTLDGGVYISDNGYAVGDKTIIVTLKQPTKIMIDKIELLTTLNSEFILSTDQGVFLCVFNKIIYSTGNATLTFLVKESA